jgi:hypothetical protein
MVCYGFWIISMEILDLFSLLDAEIFRRLGETECNPTIIGVGLRFAPPNLRVY